MSHVLVEQGPSLLASARAGEHCKYTICSPYNHQMEDNVPRHSACSMCLHNNKMYLLFGLENKKFDDKELIVYKRYNFYFLI